MALIDNNSIPSTKSELDLFTVPPTQVVVKRGFWEEIQTMNPVTNEGPYKFRLPPDPHYMQLNKNYVYLQIKLKKPPAIATAAGGPAIIPTVAPINLLGKTFFKQILLFVNGQQVSDSSDKYAYRAFFETELNFGYDAKISHLQSSLYYTESGPTVDSGDNKSFKKRAEIFKDEKVIELIAPLHIDLFLQDRYMLNYTDIRLELYRNSDEFLLQCFENVNKLELEVLQVKLFLRKIEVLDSVNLALETTLASYPAKYPIRRVMMTNLHVGNPARSTPLHTLFAGQLPRRLLFACVEGAAYRGSYKKSPFNFQPFNINEVKVICGGKTFPAFPLKVDFKNNKYIHAYNQLFEALDQAHDNKGNLISISDYTTSHCIFAFDLTPDEDDNGHWDLITEGTTSIELGFSDQLPESGVEVIVYAEFDNLIMIDRNRNTFFDYN
jgi:hypothetical protein